MLRVLRPMERQSIFSRALYVFASGSYLAPGKAHEALQMIMVRYRLLLTQCDT
eukprot:COSAG01_NODE_417_length_17291_cov_610.598825_22_plen_53_part_00